MIHARDHEQAKLPPRLTRLQAWRQTLIEGDRVVRRDQAIGPSMAEQQLAAPLEERAEAGGGDIELCGAVRPRPAGVVRIVESAEVPARTVAEHQKTHVAGRDREGLRRRRHHDQLQFAARRIAWKELRAGLWVPHAAIDRAHRLDLFGGEAARPVGPLALRDGRIEPAASRRRGQAVDQTILGVALGEIGFVQRRQLRRGQSGS